MLRRVLSVFLAVAATAVGNPGVQLRPGDTVAFVGGTDLVRLQKDGTLEAALTHRFRHAAPKFRDLAWDGDTVYFQSTVRTRWRREAFGAWPEQLKRVGATVVIVQFGKMESLDGEERLPEFVQAYGQLLDQLAGDGRRVVLLPPWQFEWHGVAAESLPAYADSVRTLAKERNLPLLDGAGNDPLDALIRNFTGRPAPRDEAFQRLRAAVREKHRLWSEYWRPANWKCLFGDDKRRVFSKAAMGRPSFQEEWALYPDLIESAEEAIVKGRAVIPREAPVRSGSREADIDKELASFEVMEGFEVNLFADESHGIANPLSVRWDAAGRMYVACSDVYPQIEPGVRANDRVVCLHDDDWDGVADRSVAFAHGLNIPTGMEVGHGTVFLGQGTELLTLRDTNKDGKADERKVLLSGFGNGDSHQTINSFAWSPGGELWFCQGDGIESRVETPTGVSTLFQAGVFRLRPERLQLDGLLDQNMGPGNPWGVVFDDYGQSFVIDGAGGVSFLTPGSVPSKRRLGLPRIGEPGGYCGVECLGARTLPEEMQGEFVIGDYKKNQVSRFAVTESGAGFKLEWRAPVLRSKHRNFRPIDVKVGPDGAIYVVDFYNPLICHQDDFFRHPDRDKTHGRIWRIAPKEGCLPRPKLEKESVPGLLAALQSSERWTRLKAKQVLASRDPATVIAALNSWSESKGGRDLLEVVAVLESMARPDRDLLARLLQSPDFRCRSYAARVAGRWSDRIGEAHELLLAAARDPHPRVRMEALLAAGGMPDPRSIQVAVAAAEAPRDRWIDYAFSQVVHHLNPVWIPAFRKGDLDFGERQKGLAAVLEEAGSKSLLAEIRTLLQKEDLQGEARENLVRALAMTGGTEDLKVVLSVEVPRPGTWMALATRERPDCSVAEPVSKALQSDDLGVRRAVLRVIANWELIEFRADVLDLLDSPQLRPAAIRTLGALGGEEAVEALKRIAELSTAENRGEAVMALLHCDRSLATRLGAIVLASGIAVQEGARIMTAFLAYEDGGQRLARGLEELTIDREQAVNLREAWLATGLADPDLGRTLDRLAGVDTEAFEFSADLVDDLVAAGRAGDAQRGKTIFHSPVGGCATCHHDGTAGGGIGPDLAAVGSGTPADRIVTEVLWPARHVKKDFSLTRLSLKGGQTVQGYRQEGPSEDELLLRGVSDGEITVLRKELIERIDDLGTSMPPTARRFSRNELADLLAYLFSLRGAGP